MCKSNSILIIDDELDIQNILREILVSEGYTVTTASSGNAAIEILKNCRDFSLIFLDFRLPDMSGFDFVAAVGSEILAQIPVVLLSATAGLKQLKLPPGIVGAVCKPFDIDELLTSVERYIKKTLPTHQTFEGLPEVS